MDTEQQKPTAATSGPYMAAAADKNPNGKRRKRLLLGLGALVIVAAIAWTVYYFLVARWYQSTDDAYVDGNVVQITPQISGTVVEIGADDGDLVQAGQVLVRLDASDAAVAEQQAEANLAKAVRQVRGLFNNVDSARADLAARRAALNRARADYARRQHLAETGAISEEELAHVREALTAAEAELAGSDQQLQTRQALVDDTVIASHPDVQTAAASLRQAYLGNVRATLVAPVTGYVAMRSVQLGSRVQSGTALMAVVPLEQLWVDANFKETQLDDMRIGQPVALESDFYGSRVSYHGHVESLGVGTGSAFSLLPAQNATGNWIKIVQRLPVRVALDPQELREHPLRVGLSMSASADLHDVSGAVLSAQPRDKPRLSTDVYDHQLADADELVTKIIHANLAGSGAATAGGSH
jgi:membrane fusion protein (multidrug efflux system)